jgi:UDP-N-acetyl-D-mannosaminuronate dehydrogenase
MKIAMIGSGYVGLVSGACFADFGHDVVCVDKDPGKIDCAVQQGEMPIFEPGLDELVASNVKEGRPSQHSPPIWPGPVATRTRSSSRWARPAAAAMAMPT